MSKKAIGYVRISTKDQSNFSIEGQIDEIQHHCTRNDMELLAMYTDEGQSAKNFDRVQWKELSEYIKKHYKKIDYLIVAKYDRFSRNLQEALEIINRLERKYNIVVLSVREQINLHPKSPFFFQQRTFILMNAEYELKVIRDRTKTGIVTANRKGRHVNGAPFGYINTRDAQNKPVIIIDPVKAKIVQQMYTWFLQGLPIEQIRKKATKIGFTIQGNSAVRKLLENPLYTGLVKVPAFYDDPSDIVEGIHQPIIDRDVWYRVQAVLNNKTITRTVINDEVPLRGVLKCYCGQCFTAGNSKGRNKYYWYYKCKEHKQNLRADKLHTEFERMLEHLSFAPSEMEYVTNIYTQKVNEGIKERRKQIELQKQDLTDIEDKINKLEEKYILSEINRAIYDKWHSQWMKEKENVSTALSRAKEPVNKIWNNYNQYIAKLGDIAALYKKVSTEMKQSFVRIVFNNELYYENGVYRTTYILPIFKGKLLILNNLGLLKIQQPQVNNGVIPLSSERGS